MKLSDASIAYIDYRYSHGTAEATISNYRSLFSRLRKAVGNPDMSQFGHAECDAWAALASDNLCAATFNSERSNLGAFLRWAHSRGLTPKGAELTESMPTRRVQKKERRRVPMSSFPALLDAAPTPRDRMVVALGLFLFLRASEVVTLRIRDVDLSSGEVAVVVHKTGDVDLMPISSELDAELRRWLSHYAELCGELQGDWLLVPAKVGYRFHDSATVLTPTKPMTRISDNVKAALVGIGWDVSGAGEGVHTLRRSGARALFDTLVDAGVDGALRRVQSYLHHSSVTMTEHYIGLTQDRAVRDREAKGKPMFPSLADASVARLRTA
jgi:integrase